MSFRHSETKWNTKGAKIFLKKELCQRKYLKLCMHPPMKKKPQDWLLIRPGSSSRNWILLQRWNLDSREKWETNKKGCREHKEKQWLFVQKLTFVFSFFIKLCSFKALCVILIFLNSFSSFGAFHSYSFCHIITRVKNWRLLAIPNALKIFNE